MKKTLLSLLIFIATLVLIACEPPAEPPILDGDALNPAELAVIDAEYQRSFNYFWETANQDQTSAGYGLIPDRYPGNPSIASIAAVGFGLAAVIIGVEEGWISFDDGFERVDLTLDTLLSMERVNGFYYHFVNMKTAKREWNSEVSIIDTALLLMGGMAASEYFGGTIKEKMDALYEDVNWPWYLNIHSQMFYMGYHPESGFSGAWDHMAEQLMIYVLASGSESYPVGKTPYNVIMTVQNNSYKGTYTATSNPDLSVTTPFYYSYNGSLFQHQFSHAFLDVKTWEDGSGVNWFENATLATKANYAYVQDQSDKFMSYGPFSWGLSASDGPGEYRAYGARPAKSNSHNGTIAPYAALASINYLPKLVGQTAVYYYHNIENLFGTYGFKDAFNLGPIDPESYPSLASKTPWVADDYIGIDKGITLLMIANYKNNLIWEYVMQNEFILKGLEVLGFKEVEVITE